MLTIGKAIRILRNAQNLKAIKVAKRAGWSASMLSQVEHEERQPSLGSLVSLATALNVPQAVFAFITHPTLIWNDDASKSIVASLRKIDAAEASLRRLLIRHDRERSQTA